MQDPEIRFCLDWFYRTHEVEAIGMGGAIWRRRHLPREGGLGAQDARLMAALDVLRQTANALLRSAQAPSAEDELKAFHQKETVH